jgi:hypothetical protein
MTKIEHQREESTDVALGELECPVLFFGGPFRLVVYPQELLSTGDMGMN